jgi:hypothetical protein
MLSWTPKFTELSDLSHLSLQPLTPGHYIVGDSCGSAARRIARTNLRTRLVSLAVGGDQRDGGMMSRRGGGWSLRTTEAAGFRGGLETKYRCS